MSAGKGEWPEVGETQAPFKAKKHEWKEVLTESEEYIKELERKLEKVVKAREVGEREELRRKGMVGRSNKNDDVDPIVAYLMEEAFMTPSGDTVPELKDDQPGSDTEPHASLLPDSLITHGSSPAMPIPATETTSLLGNSNIGAYSGQERKNDSKESGVWSEALKSWRICWTYGVCSCFGAVEENDE
ncbi:hypothetical protein HDU97_003261 [Phlyctochytrium planicorne]|nr:hypothetical protein HDU97_003261 [Phlyctochytrium planicorne]